MNGLRIDRFLPLRAAGSATRAAGFPPEEAASQIDDLVGRAFVRLATGLSLNELRFTEADIPAIENR